MNSSGDNTMWVVPSCQGVCSACHALNEQMLALAAGDKSIKKVFLISTWRQAKEGSITTSPRVKLGAAESMALFERQFAATVGALHASGKQVYIVGPAKSR